MRIKAAGYIVGLNTEIICGQADDVPTVSCHAIFRCRSRWTHNSIGSFYVPAATIRAERQENMTKRVKGFAANYNGEVIRPDEVMVPFEFTEVGAENITNPDCIKTVFCKPFL